QQQRRGPGRPARGPRAVRERDQPQQRGGGERGPERAAAGGQVPVLPLPLGRVRRRPAQQGHGIGGDEDEEGQDTGGQRELPAWPARHSTRNFVVNAFTRRLYSPRSNVP